MMRVVCGVVLGAFLAGPLLADEVPPSACSAKRASIEAQIVEARQRGNRRELAGLERALRANQENCTDESLAVERGRDIAAAEQEVSEREAELERAIRDGDPEKIAKRRAKLDEAREKLREARKPLQPSGARGESFRTARTSG